MTLFSNIFTLAPKWDDTKILYVGRRFQQQQQARDMSLLSKKNSRTHYRMPSQLQLMVGKKKLINKKPMVFWAVFLLLKNQMSNIVNVIKPVGSVFYLKKKSKNQTWFYMFYELWDPFLCWSYFRLWVLFCIVISLLKRQTHGRHNPINSRQVFAHGLQI